MNSCDQTTISMHGRVLAAHEVITPQMQEIRKMIIATIAKRELLLADMKRWYQKSQGNRYLKLGDLAVVDQTLSNLDTQYKRLWEYYNGRNKSR